MITVNEREMLIKEMCKLLDEYDYNYTLVALNKIIDAWEAEKTTLIEAFKKHPNYIEGKFMIAFTKDYEREFSSNAVVRFSRFVMDCIVDNRTFIDNLPQDITQQRIAEYCAYLPDKLYHFINNLPSHITARTISEETAKLLEEIIPQIHPHAGEKASRVVNRLLTYLNYNKHPEYNREFAKFADGLSPLVIKRHTILSINPLDYLTMSFGNSWASCHTIDKKNKRNMPNSYSGQYSSGTISYMLDGSSMVFYTVDSSYQETDYWTQPKINRQMFHYGQDKLVQGRLYPQDNDYCDNEYTPFRNIVQGIVATIFDFPNLWSVSKGFDNASKYIETWGTHYEDYCYYKNCSLSRIKERENEKHFVVGASPICINCGQEHECRENINHCAAFGECASCGCRLLHEDDVVEIDGEYYCRDCVTYCECCDTYVLNDDAYYVSSQDIHVCGYCRETYYFRCDCCDELVHRDDRHEVHGFDYVCSDCYEEYYHCCDRCEESYHENDMHYDEDRDCWYCSDCYKLMKTEEQEEN